MAIEDVDPLDIVTRPPPNETPDERAERERKEVEAKQISDAIDEDIKREKAEKKKIPTVKVLLLGQSESGKSTTLKNFRMRYDRAAWDSELVSWRTVIQLNLIRSALTILDAVQAELDGQELDRLDTGASVNTERGGTRSRVGSDEENELEGEGLRVDTTNLGPGEQQHFDVNLATPSSSPVVSSALLGSPLTTSSLNLRPSNTAPHLSIQRNPQAGVHHNSPSSSGLQKSSSSNLRKGAASRQPLLTGQHQLLKLRLAPLRRVEKDLKKKLGASAEDEIMDAAANEDFGELGRRGGSSMGGLSVPGSHGLRRVTRSTEFTVRRLKDALSAGGIFKELTKRMYSDADSGTDSSDEATELIANCREDIKALWTDENVRMVLKKRKIRLEDSAGFFLNDIDRITARGYVPSDDDVIRARLRTLGVQEYRMRVTPEGTARPATARSTSSSLGDLMVGKPLGAEWNLYDVGGSRTLRHAWLPYFENVNAIIFLAPLSCFDERLVEDSRINRLEDSFLLWRTVCSSELLRKTSLILFMNKIDLLKKKIKAGVKVRGFLPSYGDRENDVPTVVNYLKEKFRDIVKSHSPDKNKSPSSPDKNKPEMPEKPSGRVVYYYATSVVDTKSTASTLRAVQDVVLRNQLEAMKML